MRGTLIPFSVLCQAQPDSLAETSISCAIQDGMPQIGGVVAYWISTGTQAGKLVAGARQMAELRACDLRLVHVVSGGVRVWEGYRIVTESEQEVKRLDTVERVKP